MRHRLPVFLAVAAFCAGVFVSHDGTRMGAAPEAREARSGAMESLEFWSAARSYPGGNIPPDNYYRAFEWARKAELKKRPLPSGASGWKYIGPANLAGRMLSLALDTRNFILYAGSASGGLWRYRFNGSPWERVGTGYPVLGVAAIAIDTANPDLMYIGTGEVYRYAGTAGGLVVRTTRGSYGMGILKTTDGGATWTKSLDWSYHQERGVQAIRMNPLNPSTVWAATSEGIYRSTDAGMSWTNMLQMLMAQDIVINPADTSKILASTGNLGLNNTIVKSTDGGTNWSQVNPVDFSGKTVFGSYPGDPNLVYASIADSTTGVGSLWRTTNFGDSWTEMSNSTTHPIFQVQGWYSHTVAVHPTDPDTIFHAAVTGDVSADGGVTFFGGNGLYSDNHASLFDPSHPGILFVANDDGVYVGTAWSAYWWDSFSKLGTGLATGQFYNGFSCSASDPLIALGQVQDHIPGYLYTGTDIWPASAADEVGWTAIDQSNDFIMYAGTRGGGSIRKSTNRGASFGAAGGGFSGSASWNAPFVLSPSHPNVLYFGRSRIFKSTNAAASWSATNGGAVLDGNPALSMAVSATNPNIVYVGTAPMVARTHVFRTTDGGTSWTDVTGPLPDRYPLDIAIDPNDSSVVFVAYGGALTGHVFKTTDAGGNWTDVTDALPDIPATALLVDPANSAVVYLGTDIGVYVSTNAGGSWEPFNDGLPEAVLVADLAMTPSNRTLRAATHGNSVWEIPMPSTFPSLSDVVPSGGETWEALTEQTISWTQTLVSAVSIDYSTDDGATWLPVASSVPAYPDSFAWTLPPTLTSLGRVRVRAVDDTLLAAESAAVFSISYDGVIIDGMEGWNIVSVPLGVPDRSPGAVFPSATGKTYGYAGAYAAVETLETGPGYWIKLTGSGFLPIDGDSVVADTIPLSPGWNLVGSLAVPTPAASIVTVPPGLLTTPLYGYDGSYSPEDTIRPGYGYWVKSSGAGSLLLDAYAPANSPAAAFPVRSGAMERSGLTRFPDGAGIIRLTDALGRRAELAVTGREVDPAEMELYALPPVPPPGGFDVRFSTGSLLSATGGGEHPVLTQGLLAPATVSWDLPPGEAYILSAGPGREIVMRGAGTAEISSASGLALRRVVTDGGAIPSVLALDQNYPNPFNPSTRLTVAIPDDHGAGAVPVTLKVYDAAGRLAGILVDGALAPGSHTLNWNAGDLPGGVYFGMLRAGRETRTVKMLLLR